MKKLLLSIVIFCSVMISSFAQTQNPLKGIWKLSRTAKEATQDIQAFAYKAFDSDYSFSNLKLAEGELVLSHKGLFKLDLNENSYSETVELSNINASETTNKLKISLNKDQKSFILEGTIQLQMGTYQLYEVWTKID